MKLYLRTTSSTRPKYNASERLFIISYLLCSKFKVMPVTDIELVNSTMDGNYIDVCNDEPEDIYLLLSTLIKDPSFRTKEQKFIDLFVGRHALGESYYDDGLYMSLITFINRKTYEELICIAAGENNPESNDIDAHGLIKLIVDRKCYGDNTKIILPATIVDVFKANIKKHNDIKDSDSLLIQYYDVLNICVNIKDYALSTKEESIKVSIEILNTIMHGIEMTSSNTYNAIYYTIKHFLDKYFIYAIDDKNTTDAYDCFYNTLSTIDLAKKYIKTIESELWEQYKAKVFVTHAAYETIENDLYVYDRYSFYRQEFKPKGKKGKKYGIQ